jgi:hypothetical protein
MTIIQVKSKEGDWVSAMAAEVDENTFQIVDRDAEDSFQELREGDYVKGEYQDNVLYMIEKICWP